jgi:hypothetical protein
VLERYDDEVVDVLTPLLLPRELSGRHSALAAFHPAVSEWFARRFPEGPTEPQARGGRFVGGFSGEQYALPNAVDQLVRVRRAPRTDERVVVNATDPLNLVGLIVPGETVPAVRTNHVVYVDGVPAGRLAA